MPRGPRTIPSCAIFHITMRGNNKRCLFRRESEFRYFKKLLMRYKQVHKFLIYNYVLMKNHVHLIIKTTEKTNISKALQGLQISYIHYYKKRRNFIGHLWQDRFKSHIIEEEKYLIAVTLYIEKNPYEAYLVNDPMEYPWSSYRYYAAGSQDRLIDTNPLYMDLGNTPEDRRIEYRNLMSRRILDSERNGSQFNNIEHETTIGH